MSSCAGHVTIETVFGQTLALRLGNGDDHYPLESDTTGLNVKGNLYLYLIEMATVQQFYRPLQSKLENLGRRVKGLINNIRCHLESYKSWQAFKLCLGSCGSQ